MSTRVEWLRARHVTAVLVPGGERMPDGQRVDVDCLGLVLELDECTVIEGTRAELAAFLLRLHMALDPVAEEGEAWYVRSDDDPPGESQPDPRLQPDAHLDDVGD